MSQFEIKCPHCGVALSIQEEWIGMILECPECKQNFSVQESQDEAPSTEQKPSGGNEPSDGGQHDEFSEKTPAAEQKPSGGNELSDNGQHGEFCEDNPSAEQKNAGGNEPIDDTQRGESCEKNPSTEQKNSGENELSDDTQHGEFSEDNPPQKGKNQPMQNQSETQPVNSRKSRRLIFLIVGSLILLAAVSVSIICSLKVSSAIADGQRLLSDPNKFPDTSALTEAKAKLDKVNSKYWFVFAKRRTEKLIEQLETARMAASVMDESESILRNGQSDKFQETIDKLKQNAAKYPFPFAKRRTEKLIEQLGSAQIVVSVIAEGESILRNRQYGKFQETIDKLKQTAAKYPFAFAKRRMENLIKQLNAPVPSREVLKILKINDPAASPQLTIMKEINLSNKSYLMVLPLDLESEAAQISRGMGYIRLYWREYDRLRQIQDRIMNEYRQMPQDNSISSLRLRVAKLRRANQVGSEMSRPRKAAKALHQKVDNWIQNEMRRSITVVNGIHNTWKLSNIHGPVVLLVWEIVYFGDKFFSYQGWYKVYEPSSSPETWTLN